MLMMFICIFAFVSITNYSKKLSCLKTTVFGSGLWLDRALHLVWADLPNLSGASTWVCRQLLSYGRCVI